MYRKRGFGLKRRYLPGQHFGLTRKDWQQFIFAKKKRRNRFLKPVWELPFVDRHGRPPQHPLYQKPKISN
jgi:hypothetical protein